MYSLLFNNFSGVTLYDAFLYQLVNILYTSVPIMVYSLFDKELEADSLLTNPDFYFVGIKNMYFNSYIFVLWIAYAISYALIIGLFSSFLEFQPQENGRYLGFWGYGVFVFLITQIVSNLKVIIFSNSFGFWIYFFILGGIGLFIASFAVISAVEVNYHYQVMNQLMSYPMTYFMILFLIVVCTFFDHLWELVQKMLFFRHINLEPWKETEKTGSRKSINCFSTVELYHKLER